MPDERARLEAIMRKKLSTISTLSLSVDAWTSGANRGYIAVTGHGITESWVLETLLLSMTPVTENEMGQFIAFVIQDTLRYWDISETRVVTITSDGAPNAKNTVVEQLDKPWVYCFAHVINGSVRKALEHRCISDVFRSANNISKFFKKSSKAARSLKECQTALNLLVKSMAIDNDTRWGSAYQMMARLCESRRAVSACLAEVTGTRDSIPDDLTTSQWSTIKRLVELLRAINESSEYISQQHHPTIGVVMVVMNQVMNAHLVGQAEKEADTSDAVDKFRSVMLGDLKRRWPPLSLDTSADTVILAVYLDPRVKNFFFIERRRTAAGTHSKGRSTCGDVCA